LPEPAFDLGAARPDHLSKRAQLQARRALGRLGVIPTDS
jgi:hypothetical protein